MLPIRTFWKAKNAARVFLRGRLLLPMARTASARTKLRIINYELRIVCYLPTVKYLLHFLISNS